MKNQYLMIVTPFNRESYLVNEKGYITQYQENPTFSEDWKFLGLVPTHKSGKKYIPFKDISPELIRTMRYDLTFKTTGNPKYTVRDLDHNTVREWSNTSVHGVINLGYVDFETT